jgi:nucleotide-binding universal stress UspA family protein
MGQSVVLFMSDTTTGSNGHAAVSIAKILVPSTGTARDHVAIAAAVNVAKFFNAHVLVQFVHPDPAAAIPLLGVPLTGEAMQAIIDGQTEFALAAAARARDTMTAICRRENVQILGTSEHRDNASCSFRQHWGNVQHSIADTARLSDLVVFGPVRWRDSPELNDAFLDVLRTVRRPVLIANHAPRGQLRKIAVGWDGSAFAADAIRRAIPFLRRVEMVTIVVVRRRNCAAPFLEELTNYLSRNEVNFVLCVTDASDAPPAEALMREATTAGADMLIAGGFGHDHLWEIFFGGVTEALLAKAELPILLAR